MHLQNQALIAAVGLVLASAASPVFAADPTSPAASPSTSGQGHADRVLWGDQHVHTANSGDAGLAGTRLTPEDAVRFARGYEVLTNTNQKAQLHRAFDWVVISDHSDGLGAVASLQTGNPEMLADSTVKRWYDEMNGTPQQQAAVSREVINAQAAKTLPKTFMDPKWMKTTWQANVDTMEKYNEPGKFTAFIGFEWTSNGDIGQNLHRNVIFRDGADKTRDILPLTTFESTVAGRKGTDPESLWNWLSDWEARTGGHVLAIPHNANMSNGWMFSDKRYDGTPLTPELAAARARWEPDVEIFQYKGQGEAHPSLSTTDEFAKMDVSWDTADLAGNPKKPEDLQYEYARQALTRGMLLERTLGTNPFKFGMVSGTDTHMALSTGAEENNWFGKFPNSEPHKDRWNEVYKTEANYLRKDWTLSAAGLTGVWATANTREAIWDAFKRKEVYASTGPRITVRMFVGWNFSDADTKGNLVASGYARGVPMGGDLNTAAAGRAPTVLFAAMKDPAGANLDRVQIVKGWVDASGAMKEKIYDVKWSGNRKPGADGKLAPVGDTVNKSTAKYTNSIGSTELIGAFRDPDFDPTLPAYYYVRVVEIPTPRWTLYDAVRFGAKLAPEVPTVVQERAVTSPVWYTPQR